MKKTAATVAAIPLTKARFGELNLAIRYRAFQQQMAQQSWWWKLRNRKEVKRLRAAFVTAQLDVAVNRAMERAGLNPDAVYTLDSTAFTATIQTPKP